jgi:hypothetical protein
MCPCTPPINQKHPQAGTTTFAAALWPTSRLLIRLCLGIFKAAIGGKYAASCARYYVQLGSMEEGHERAAVVLVPALAGLQPRSGMGMGMGMGMAMGMAMGEWVRMGI